MAGPPKSESDRRGQNVRASDGTGRHDGLKIRCWEQRAGSSPALRTGGNVKSYGVVAQRAAEKSDPKHEERDN